MEQSRTWPLLESQCSYIAQELNASFTKDDNKLIDAFSRKPPINEWKNIPSNGCVETNDPISEELFLKELASSHNLSARDNLSKWAPFIIHDWGGIHSFRIDENRISDIQHFIHTCAGPVSTNNISSFSKVAAFYKPKDYFVYDSRVAYSINWLLFKNDYRGLFFPIPDSQVKRIRDYDLSTILRLCKRRHYGETSDGRKKRSKQEREEEGWFFADYCALVKGIYKELKRTNDVIKHYESNGKEYPGLVEMMLYAYLDIAIEELKKIDTLNRALDRV